MLSKKFTAVAGAAAEATDDYFKNTTLLLSGDGTNGAQNNTFTDSSTNNFTITRNGNTTQGSYSPYGSLWSNYFSSGNYIYTTSATPLVLSGGGSWTIEAFAFCTGGSSYRSVLSKRTGGTAEYEFGIDGSGYMYVYIGTTVYASTTTVPLNQWTHLAVSYDGTNLRLFQDGVVTKTQAGVTAGSGTGNLAISIEAGTGGQAFPGYISNVRITKGGALYTANFTPSTTQLTTTVSSGSVSLLTCQSNRFIDTSSNAYTITLTGTPTVERFSPFNPTAAYSTATIGGSGYFDGTSDTLSLANNAAFNPGAGDWCAELWVYPTYTSGSDKVAFGNFTVTSYPTNCPGWDFIQPAYNTISFRWGYPNYSDSGAFSVNPSAWNHVVASRSGGRLSLFINGTRVYTTTSNTSISDSSLALYIGASNTNNVYNGYISDARIVKGGTTPYDPTQTTITVPTTPLTAIANTSLLANMTNAGIPDNAMMNDLETVGNAQISTSVKKYGTGSIAFDGSGDYLVAPYSPNYQLGTGDFTIEFWINASASGSYTQIIGTQNVNADDGCWRIGNRFNNTNYIYFARGNGTNFNENTYNSNVNDGNWHHVAFVRASGITTLYVDGSSVAPSTGSTSNLSGTCSSNNQLRLGINPRDNAYVTGYLDDVRITKGYARYTSNFTAPTEALPAY